VLRTCGRHTWCHQAQHQSACAQVGKPAAAAAISVLLLIAVRDLCNKMIPDGAITPSTSQHAHRGTSLQLLLLLLSACCACNLRLLTIVTTWHVCWLLRWRCRLWR
jgi:hypothetical protein